VQRVPGARSPCSGWGHRCGLQEGKEGGREGGRKDWLEGRGASSKGLFHSTTGMEETMGGKAEGERIKERTCG
jgi:hypothetical protein